MQAAGGAEAEVKQISWTTEVSLNVPEAVVRDGCFRSKGEPSLISGTVRQHNLITVKTLLR